MIDGRTRQAIELMRRFAERTGEARRYLWTDAFAVMNYLGLARATRDQTFLHHAVTLIDRVHQYLRPRGGRSESEGQAHPTAAGLRIGKPLGIGGLLADAYRLEQFAAADHVLEATLVGALAGLRQFVRQPELQSGADQRLAFRELGLAIGLAAVEHMTVDAPPRLRPVVDELDKFMTLRNVIEDFWLSPQNQQTDAWRQHADINDVMLATSLVPNGYVSLLNRTRQSSYSA